jgi:abequosyltransferase
LFNLADVLQKKDYFRSARTSEAFFSFMSRPIFKKIAWDSASVPESFRGTCWIVAGHLLSLIPAGITVKYLGEILLHKRGENDSFANRGIVNRFRIAIEAFQHIANMVFGEYSEEAFHIRRVLRQDIPFRALIMAKLMAFKSPEKEDINVLNRIVKIHYANAGFENRMKYVFYKMVPVVMLEMAYSIKKCITR